MLHTAHLILHFTVNDFLSCESSGRPSFNIILLPHILQTVGFDDSAIFE